MDVRSNVSDNRGSVFCVLFQDDVSIPHVAFDKPVELVMVSCVLLHFFCELDGRNQVKLLEDV